jgi:hypothetical protein
MPTFKQKNVAEESPPNDVRYAIFGIITSAKPFSQRQKVVQGDAYDHDHEICGRTKDNEIGCLLTVLGHDIESIGPNNLIFFYS